ncbi:MAG: SAM-dependent methyltransferase [Alphaproteobacteria bacterium]
MKERQPSWTAMGAAGYRAAHQVLEGGKVFTDPFARTILGREADVIIARLSADPAQRPIRIFMAARSRFAEDCLGVAVSRGVRQAVVLGAGFDTFSLRNPYSELGLRVFEVDHPSTQAWKLKRLAEAGLAVPASLAFATVDFESQGLSRGLVAAGFKPDRPAFFVWLGVVPYLEREAIAATLGYIASVPGSEVVFDYSEPLENYPPERRGAVAAVSAWAAEIGEPWLSHFDPAEISQNLREYGFQDLEDLGLAEISIRYLGVPAAEATSSPGPHVIRARIPGGQVSI